MTTTSRLLSSTLLMAAFFGGTLSYHFIEHVSWWDSFFMTVITLTTVGYREVFQLSRAG
jgi:voltage-gated potassium channel